MKSVCLICGSARIETVCGDQSCPCGGGSKWSSLRAIVLPGLCYRDKRGNVWETQSCGRRVLVETAPTQEKP